MRTVPPWRRGWQTAYAAPVGGQTGSDGVALVTGAGGGIGRAIARALALTGHPVALVERDAAALAAVVTDVETAAGVPVVGVQADVRFPAEVAAACARATVTLGPVEILVGAAGVYGPRVAFVDSDPDEWWQVVETNMRGAALFARRPAVDARAPLRLHRERGQPRGLLGRSRAVERGVLHVQGRPRGFTGALAAEVAGTGVFVFDLGPGLVRTNMTATRPDRAEIPDDAFVPAAVVADAVVALVSGRYPELHGRFVHATDDLDELVVRVGAVPHVRTLGLVPSGAGDRIASPAFTARTAAPR